MGQRPIKPKSLAALATALGGVLCVVGVALISIPAAVVLAGVGFLALGLFAIEVDG